MRLLADWESLEGFAADGGPVDSQKSIYEYDALGRTVKVTPPPGNAGFTSYEYGGTTFENDSLGNLVAVTEPFPGPGSGTDFVATYAALIFRKLTTVTKTRTFSYESGTVISR